MLTGCQFVAEGTSGGCIDHFNWRNRRSRSKPSKDGNDSLAGCLLPSKLMIPFARSSPAPPLSGVRVAEASGRRKIAVENLATFLGPQGGQKVKIGSQGPCKVAFFAIG